VTRPPAGHWTDKRAARLNSHVPCSPSAGQVHPVAPGGLGMMQCHIGGVEQTGETRPEPFGYLKGFGGTGGQEDGEHSVWRYPAAR
jgi:hypothetical protein